MESHATSHDEAEDAARYGVAYTQDEPSQTFPYVVTRQDQGGSCFEAPLPLQVLRLSYYAVSMQEDGIQD
jgi:hypothetical protein